MLHNRERGGASLFVVIFVIVVITVVTVGFTQLMINNQKQATSSDLSQRAYNSALAGVEDAKRILVAAKQACQGGSADQCAKLTTAINSGDCDTLERAGIASVDKNGKYKETTVGKLSDNQAYTCVIINTRTADYQDSLKADSPVIVPLTGASPFNTVKVSWYVQKDSVAAGQAAGDSSVHFYSGGGLTPLPPKSSWASAPSILRIQYIPATGNASSLTSTSKTLFLYPLAVGASSFDFNLDPAGATDKGVGPQPVGCRGDFSSVSGACSATVKLPGEITSGYLQLTPLYNATHVTLELYNDATKVDFNGVQPSVDSTGRAAELFRRVNARVKISAIPLPAPEAAIDIQGNLCKNFALSDSGGNSYNPGNCEP